MSEETVYLIEGVTFGAKINRNRSRRYKRQVVTRLCQVVSDRMEADAICQRCNEISEGNIEIWCHPIDNFIRFAPSTLNRWGQVWRSDIEKELVACFTQFYHQYGYVSGFIVREVKLNTLPMNVRLQLTRNEKSSHFTLSADSRAFAYARNF